MRTVLFLAIALLLQVPLRAQCPHGSPPPCGRTASRPPAPHSVAVTYFVARDTADAYLAEGLAEDATSLLGGVASVQVKSSRVVQRVQRSAPGNMPTIARTLGVHYLPRRECAPRRHACAGHGSVAQRWHGGRGVGRRPRSDTR